MIKKNKIFIAGHNGLVGDAFYRIVKEQGYKKIIIADKKKFMPPKSTWFHPKPLDGLICSEL